MPVTRAMRKKEAEIEPNTKENAANAKVRKEKEQNDVKRKETREETKGAEAKKQATNESKATKRKAGPACQTGRQKNNVAFSIFSPPSAQTPATARHKVAFQTSPPAASPRRKKAKADLQTRVVTPFPEKIVQEPAAEFALPPRVKRKPVIFTPQMSSRKPPRVPVSVVPPAISASVATKGFSTVPKPPPLPPVVVASSGEPRREETLVNPKKKDASKPDALGLVEPIADNASIASSRPRRVQAKRNYGSVKVTVSRRNSGARLNPKSATKPKHKPTTKRGPTQAQLIAEEKREQDHRQLRNLVNKLGPNGAWEKRIVQITEKTATMIIDSKKLLNEMCTQTRENWNENRHNLRRAIQQTPMMRNLRSRKFDIDDTKKNVISLETLTESPTELVPTMKPTKFKFAPAKNLVTNLKKRALSPDTPDSPRRLRHQIPEVFDFKERSQKPLAKKMAFEFDSFFVAEAVQAFEKLALKSQEKPKIAGSAFKWTPKQSDSDSVVFKIPQTPSKRPSAHEKKRTQSPLPAVDVQASFLSRRSPEDDAQNDASYYTCSERFSSVESLPPQTDAAEPIQEISENPDISLDMDFAGSDEPELNSTFCVESAPTPAENQPTIKDSEMDEQRKSTLKITSGLDSTFQIETGCSTTFNKYSEPQEVSPDIPPPNGNSTFNINSGSQKVTPVAAHPNVNATFIKTVSQKFIPVLAPPNANETFSIVSEVQKAFSSGSNPNATFSVPTPEVPLVPTPDKTFVAPTPKKPFKFVIPLQDSSDEDSFISCHNESLNNSLDNIQITPHSATEKSVKIKSEYGAGNQTYQIIGGTPANPNQTYVAQSRSSVSGLNSKNFPADEEIPDHDLNPCMEMSISETNIDTYDITLYEDLDEENSHRASKVLPGWAADRTFLTLQLYTLNPSFLDKTVDDFVFPGMPKFKLFPGAMAPRRRP